MAQSRQSTERKGPFSEVPTGGSIESSKTEDRYGNHK
jgi:hypothetical protein